MVGVALMLGVAPGAKANDDNPFARSLAALEALVSVRATAVPGARSSTTLGPVRAGSGVVIDREGLIVTIGYLILEADSVEVTVGGRTLPANVVGYDPDSGFGLLRTVTPPGVKPMPLGRSGALGAAESAVAAAAPNPMLGIGPAAQPVMVVAKRRFAGYWEYMLDEGLFTAPPIANFGGAALVSAEGRLLGIGSLQVPDASTQPRMAGNMFVPVDLLTSIMGDLLASGRTLRAPRPWLGVTSTEMQGRVVVARVTPDGPADKAGLAAGDVVLSVDGREVRDLAEFYQRIWATGDAGIEVPLTVQRAGGRQTLRVKSIDRLGFLKAPGSF
jgi:S1-C subfamily serine protease